MKKLLFLLLFIFLLTFSAYSDNILSITGRGVKKIYKNNFLYILTRDNHLNIYKEQKKLFEYSGDSLTDFIIDGDNLYLWESDNRNTTLKILDINSFNINKQIYFENRIEKLFKHENFYYIFFINGGMIRFKNYTDIPRNITKKYEMPFWKDNFHIIENKIVYYFNKKFYFFEKESFKKFYEIPTYFFKFNDEYILYKNNKSKIVLYNMMEDKKKYYQKIDEKWKYADIIKINDDEEANSKVIYFVIDNELMILFNENKTCKQTNSEILFIEDDGSIISKSVIDIKNSKINYDQITRIFKIEKKYYIVVKNSSFLGNKYYILIQNSLTKTNGS